MRRSLLILALAALTACGDDKPAAPGRSGGLRKKSAVKPTPAPAPMPEPKREPPPDAASYTETIPGTKVSFDMVWVADGGFWIGKHELTWDEYELFYLEDDTVAPNADAVARPSKSYHPHDRGWGRGKRPACGLTKHAAKRYAAWLSKQTGKRYRLPTSKQWQMAARAGREGDAPADIDARAWTKADANEQTHPVGKKQANPLGIHDLFGNVMEWLDDPGATEDDKGSLAGGSYTMSGPDLRYDLVTPFQFEWHERDPQRPRSTWWLCDGPVVGVRLVRVP